jgi:tRNA/tmRNA/rRNA uracil-C5-methylase (TrmA/RlmC/RlmD family)
VAGIVNAASCPHRPPCPGCPRFGQPDIAPIARYRLDALARTHGLPPVDVAGGSTAGFRLRARLAVRGRLNSPKLGLFELGTHRVVHIPNCVVQHPLINRVAGVVRRALVDAGVTSYSDAAHMGLVRHLQVVIERSTQTAQVVLVANCRGPEPLASCLDLIRERLGGDLHSLWVNTHGDRTNTILGPDFHRCCGPESVVERFGGAAVHYPPGAFGQNNLGMAQNIIDHIRALIPHGSRVAEFYAGVGAIGLSILARAGEMRMNELSPASLHGLELGLAQLDAEEREKISLVPGSAAEAYPAASGMQVVIADPPRKGLDAQLIEQLTEQPPERFVYVSCGLDSLVNDTARLTRTGTLTLQSLAAFNLFPFTDHVEAVACFERGQYTSGTSMSAGTACRE